MIDNGKKLSIKNWAIEDRPREKMMAKGEKELTDAELLAILIGSGTTKKSAIEIMEEILADCDGRLSNLSKLSIGELMKYSGIGEAKAITLKAAAEIGRRRADEKAEQIKQIQNSKDVYDIMRSKIQDNVFEEFWVFMLNNNARIIKKKQMSKGGMTQTAVDVRMVLKEAIMADATSIVLCHNHPSGSLNPSKDDRQLTAKIKAAAATMNIRLIDHVIVTDGNYYSFADHGEI